MKLSNQKLNRCIGINIATDLPTYLLTSYSDHPPLCVILSLRFCDSVRTIKPKRLKLKSPNLTRLDSPSEYIAKQLLILDHKVKDQGQRVTKCTNIVASCTILQQPRSAAMVFQRGCSFTLPLNRILLGDRMAGVSYAPLSSAPLVIIHRKTT